jgi:HPt (histidine-containing phosphotransfer) domain-containing protein
MEMRADIGWLRSRYLDTLLQFLIVGSIGIGVTGVAANLLIRRITRPITLLTKDLVAMGEHPDLSRRFLHDSRDEAGVLAGAIVDAVADALPLADVAALIHALKSMSSSAGAARAAATCEKLEQAAKEDRLPSDRDLRDLFAVVDDTVGAMYRQLSGAGAGNDCDTLRNASASS